MNDWQIRRLSQQAKLLNHYLQPHGFLSERETVLVRHLSTVDDSILWFATKFSTDSYKYFLWKIANRLCSIIYKSQNARTYINLSETYGYLLTIPKSIISRFDEVARNEWHKLDVSSLLNIVSVVRSYYHEIEITTPKNIHRDELVLILHNMIQLRDDKEVLMWLKDKHKMNAAAHLVHYLLRKTHPNFPSLSSIQAKVVTANEPRNFEGITITLNSFAFLNNYMTIDLSLEMIPTSSHKIQPQNTVLGMHVHWECIEKLSDTNGKTYVSVERRQNGNVTFRPLKCYCNLKLLFFPQIADIRSKLDFTIEDAGLVVSYVNSNGMLSPSSQLSLPLVDCNWQLFI